MMWLIQHVFVVAFLSAFTVGVSILGYVAASVVCVFIRMFIPNFAVPYETPAPVKEDTPLDQKRIAMDWLFLRRQKLLRALHDDRHMSTANINELLQKRIDADEFDLESVTKLIAKPVPPKNVKLEKHLTEKAEYALAFFPTGPQGPTRYLCARRIERGGSRFAFASLPEKAMRFDLQSAVRLSSVLSVPTFPIPMNASARIQTRKTEGGNNATASA